MKIVIGKDATQLAACDASIEAGRYDGVCHFDHHAAYEAEDCPCSHTDIQAIPVDAVIGVTHMDADTFVGLLRLLGRHFEMTALKTVGVDFDLVAKYDIKVPGLPRGLNITKCFMLAVTAASMKIPRPPAKGVIDITEQVMEIIASLTKEGGIRRFLAEGQALGERAEALYKERLRMTTTDTHGRRIGLWSLREGETMDPTRPYEDGYSLVVIYRQGFGSASLYANDDIAEALPGVWAGVLFQGHPHACGSERGKTFSQEEIKLATVALAMRL